LNMHGRILKDLRYADDVDLMAETENGLQELLTSQAESSKGYGLQINRNKTKVLLCTRNGREDPLPKITCEWRTAGVRNGIRLPWQPDYTR
jgi:hypothetical protein